MDKAIFLKCELLREDLFDKEKLRYKKELKAHKKYVESVSETEIEFGKDPRRDKPDIPEVESYKDFTLNLSAIEILDFWEETDHKRGEKCVVMLYNQFGDKYRAVLKGTEEMFLECVLAPKYMSLKFESQSELKDNGKDDSENNQS